jgi:hypothetical protein
MTDAPVTLDEILRAEPRALGHLATSDRATWQTLDRHLHGADACPPVLVHALLAIDDVAGWAGRLFPAFSGLNPDEGMGADWHFRRWLSAGIVNTLPPTDIVVLRVRYTTASNDTEPGTTSRVAALVDDIEHAGDGATHRALLGRALLLLARRLGEDDEHDAAIAAATRAEQIFTQLGDAMWSAQAVRIHAGALLRKREIDAALALLDTVLDSPCTHFASEGAHRGGRAIQNPDGTYRPEKILAPLDAALDEAAKIAAWAGRDEPQWIAARAKILAPPGYRDSVG